MYLDGNALGARRTADRSRVPLTVKGTALSSVLDERGRSGRHDRVVRIDMRTVQDGDESPRTQVYVHVPTDGTPRVVGLQRQ